MENQIQQMTAAQLLSPETFDRIFDSADEITKTRLLLALQDRAEELGCHRAARSLISAYRTEESKMLEQLPRRKVDFPVEYDRSGRIRRTINNFEQIIANDPYFAGLQYNLLTNAMERVTEDGQAQLWTDADDNLAFSYIEREYRIQSTQFCLIALANVARSRAYHPIKRLIEAEQWDGQKRIDNFLCHALKCEDTPYTREVSRLIFAGGIHRIYNPGCKFDSVPVLIGRQGEGKSTAVRLLAIQDQFYTDTFTIEGKDGMETITGKWICELSELLALTKAREVESIKSFLSRQMDHYRRAYERKAADYPRQCVFIGTTNQPQFLTDKTGNRRFLPVRVHGNGYELIRREQELRAYIRQCWAEAKTLYDQNALPPFPDPKLLSQITKEQAEAVEEDYRVGLIVDYLHGRDRVCGLDLWKNALLNEYTKPTPKDSREISTIMNNMPGWERCKKPEWFTGFGTQRYWQRIE